VSLSLWEHSCPNYEMRFAPEAGLMRVSWDSLFGNLFRACPAPLGEGGAKRRVRAGNAPSSGPSGHLLQREKEPPFRLIWTPLPPEGEGHALPVNLALKCPNSSTATVLPYVLLKLVTERTFDISHQSSFCVKPTTAPPKRTQTEFTRKRKSTMTPMTVKASVVKSTTIKRPS